MCEFWNSLECLGEDPSPALPVSDTEEAGFTGKSLQSLSFYSATDWFLQLLN